MFGSFDEYDFKRRVQEAIEVTKRVLDLNKNPKLPSSVPHKYEDKYILAETLTNVAAAAHLNCLTTVGLTDKQLCELVQWVGEERSSVTLRLQSEEQCKFLREAERKVESDSYVRETTVRTAGHQFAHSTGIWNDQQIFD
jgi:hypothetical protein